MNCSICKDLERTLEFRRSQYLEARSGAYYRVTTELAAYKNVDMERAKSDLEEHQLVCILAAKACLDHGPAESQSMPGVCAILG